MTGIGSTLSIAKLALSAQQYGISVTGQNVANVDNESYTRQTLAMTSGTSVKIGSLVLGNGVSVSQVKSVSDSYLEASLMNKKADLACSEEKELYLTAIENLVSSDSENGLSALLSEFWNAWSDLSNNPAGDAERVVVYETGNQLAEQFNALSQNLSDIRVNLDSEIGTAISEINSMAAQIAELNADIVAMEAGGGSANDLRDQRSALLNELSESMGITNFEESDGSVSVMTATSYPLVSGDSVHTVSFSSGRILWNGTDASVDITDRVSNGRIKGWLEIRDENLPEIQTELDGLAESLIYQVNEQTSVGVGTGYLSEPVTGSYATAASGLFSTLTYADRLDTSADFVLWIKNDSASPATFTDVAVDLSTLSTSTTYTLTDLATDINAAVTAAGGGVTASVADNRLVLTPDSSQHSFAIGTDNGVNCGLAAILGLNTFFTGSNASTMAVNADMSDTDRLQTGQVDAATGDITSGGNSNALLTAALQDEEIQSVRYTFERGKATTSQNLTGTAASLFESLTSEIAIQSKITGIKTENCQELVSSIQAQRDSVSAVSLDEEVINLTQYQTAYSAASKLLSIADEMLNTLLSVR